MTHLAIPTSSNVCCCTTWGNLTKQNTHWNWCKTLINSIYPHLWPASISWLQGLTTMQQCVYQIAFRNFYEFKKQLAKSGLVWSRTLLPVLSMHRKIVSVSAFAQWADISSNFTASSWKKQLDEMSASVPKILTKCVPVHYLYQVMIPNWVKCNISLVLHSPGSVQKQMMGEVEN